MKIVKNKKNLSKIDEFKISEYNYNVISQDKVVWYNSFSDKMFALTIDESKKVNDFFLNLQLFVGLYPTFFKKLVDWGFIVNYKVDEYANYKQQYTESISERKIYKLSINPTLECNFSCWYCSMGMAKIKPSKAFMSEDVIARIYQNVKNKIVNDGVKRFELEWFGGEPMLHYYDVMLPLARDLSKLCIDNDVIFIQAITSNGFLFEFEMIESLLTYNMTQFQITLDGYQKKHDKIRKENNSDGSYLKIISNLKMLSLFLPSPIIIIRINYDMKILENIDTIILDLDGVNKDNILISLHKVWQIKKSSKLSALVVDAQNKFEVAGYRIHHWAYQPKRFFTCGLDRENHMAINYDGGVFKCNARDYSDKYKIGEFSLEGNILFNEDLISNYYHKLPFEKNEFCKDCKHLPVCGGPCIQKASEYQKGGDFSKYCVVKNAPISVEEFVLNQAKQRCLV